MPWLEDLKFPRGYQMGTHIIQYFQGEFVMKKKLGNILIFVLIIGLTIGYGIYKDSQSTVTVNKIYTMEFQEQALSDLEHEKGNGNYTLQNIFMKYNPFSTNTQSMYVYFNTSKVAKITYTVSCSDYADFTATANQAKEYQKEHEFQLIGLIPNCTNTITITATYKDGTSQSVSTNYTMGSLLGDEDIQLKQVSGTKQYLGNGLYTLLGNDAYDQDFVYMYDTNGVLRGEIPIIGYRSHRMLIQNQILYMSVSTHRMAAINHLGRIEHIYNLGNYIVHHDYQFDQDGNLILLATNEEKNSVEDCIIKLDVDSEEVSEVLDLEDLFKSYKESTDHKEGSKWDWMHINTLQYLNDDSVILSSRETSSIIKINDVSTNPSIGYIIGNEDFWKDTDYTKYLFTKVGDFLTSGGQHTVTYMEDDALESGQYYLYMFDNNFGYSKTRKDYDWTVNEGIQTSITEGTTSYYYQYLVDENEGTYTLANSFEVPFSAYVSSAQNLGDHIVVDSGIAGLLSIYDTDGNLEQQFSIKKNDRFIYRIYYYDYKGYYFS